MTQQNDCDIARDLMPLSIDGVCSEGSQRFLDDHVARCLPCQQYYTGIKAAPLPQMSLVPDEDAQALRHGIRWLGKRFKALWTALIALLCAFVLLLAIGGVQQMLWHWTSTAPVDSYILQLVHDGVAARVAISANFPAQTYNGSSCNMKYVTDTPENSTGAPQAVILTYSVSYFPNQAKDIMKTISFVQPFNTNPEDSVEQETSDPVLLPKNFLYQGALHNQRLCVEDGKLYLAEKLSSVSTITGKTLLVMIPGLPISEIRCTDGKNTRTIYNWGDEIFRTTYERFDEYGLPQSGVITPSELEKYADFIIK